MKPSTRILAAASFVLLLLAVFVLGRWSADPDASPQEQAAEASADTDTLWSCSMHPQIKDEKPGLCPICGMDLIPLNNDAHEPSPIEVVLSENAQKLARIQTTRVTSQAPAKRSIRLLGRVDIDETSQRTVTAWTSGRIERLHVATTGERVRKHQVVATLYSPEIYTARRDLLLAQKQTQRHTQSGASALALQASRSALDAARQKLRLLGVPNAEIRKMEASGKASNNVSIRARAEGTILQRLVEEGTWIKEGTPLYKLADLQKLWVQLDAYETDLQEIQKGQPVILTFQALPGEEIEGVVTFIDPVVNPATRTTRVRVEVPNLQGNLRPGMFAEATLQSADHPTKRPLFVPRTAPLFSGRRSLVYVELPHREKPTYQAREVRLGTRQGEFYPVIAGLKEGERVVTHGAFKLDADLQIRGGLSMMARQDDKERPLDNPIRPGQELQGTVQTLLNEYLQVQEALAADSTEFQKPLRRFLRTVREHKAPQNPGEAKAWGVLQKRLESHAAKLQKAENLSLARQAFLGLSEVVKNLLNVFGAPPGSAVYLAFCPMANENRGGYWLQKSPQIANPYFGAQMLTCGEIKTALSPHNEEPASKPRSKPQSSPSSKTSGHQNRQKAPSKPRNKPGSKPQSKPGSKPASKPRSKPASKPGSQPASKPQSQPASAHGGRTP